MNSINRVLIFISLLLGLGSIFNVSAADAGGYSHLIKRCDNCTDREMLSLARSSFNYQTLGWIYIYLIMLIELTKSIMSILNKSQMVLDTILI